MLQQRGHRFQKPVCHKKVSAIFVKRTAALYFKIE